MILFEKKREESVKNIRLVLMVNYYHFYLIDLESRSNFGRKKENAMCL